MLASAAAFSAPAWAIFQNASGLLVTKATLTLPDPGVGQPTIKPASVARVRQVTTWRGLMVQTPERSGRAARASRAEHIGKCCRGKDKGLQCGIHFSRVGFSSP